MSRRRRSRNQRPLASVTAIEPPPSTTRELAASTAVNVTAAALDGYAAAKQEAAQAVDLAGALEFCIPEAWLDDDARDLIGRLASNDLVTVLAWLSCNWHQGYGTGYVDGKSGARPVGELGSG